MTFLFMVFCICKKINYYRIWKWYPECVHGFCSILKIKHHLSFLNYQESYKNRLSLISTLHHIKSSLLRRVFYYEMWCHLTFALWKKQDAWSFLLELLLSIQMLGGTRSYEIESFRVSETSKLFLQIDPFKV